MKAAVIREPGATPEYADFGEPIVSEGHVQAELVAAGIHPVVRSLAAGLHYGSAGKYPLVPGVDAVARIADGTLVYTGYIQPPYGTLAERMAIPAATQFVLPEGAQPERVAGGINPGMSSWLPLRTRRDRSRGHSHDTFGMRSIEGDAPIMHSCREGLSACVLGGGGRRTSPLGEGKTFRGAGPRGRR